MQFRHTLLLHCFTSPPPPLYIHFHHLSKTHPNPIVLPSSLAPFPPPLPSPALLSPPSSTPPQVAVCKDLPITLVFLPASDIANYVGLGDVDMGITGEDCVAEAGVDVKEELKLGFGKCRLCVQAPVRKQVKSVEELAGGR